MPAGTTATEVAHRSGVSGRHFHGAAPAGGPCRPRRDVNGHHRWTRLSDVDSGGFPSTVTAPAQACGAGYVMTDGGERVPEEVPPSQVGGEPRTGPLTGLALSRPVPLTPRGGGRRKPTRTKLGSTTTRYLRRVLHTPVAAAPSTRTPTWWCAHPPAAAPVLPPPRRQQQRVRPSPP